MNYLLEVCLVVTVAVFIPRPVAAQSQAGTPLALQKGISVELPATTNATTMPHADQQDALILRITADGSVHVGVDRVSSAALAETVKVALANGTEKRLYLKADARTSYANVARVIDAVRASGVEELNLLTAQPESQAQGSVVLPKGIRVCLVSRCPEAQR